MRVSDLPMWEQITCVAVVWCCVFGVIGLFIWSIIDHRKYMREMDALSEESERRHQEYMNQFHS